MARATRRCRRLGERSFRRFPRTVAPHLRIGRRSREWPTTARVVGQCVLRRPSDSNVMLVGVASERPVSYRTLERGADVISADGHRVGVVKHVLADEHADIFDGLVIDVSFGPGGLHFVDARNVAEIRQDGVALVISATEVERLPKPQPNPAVMESHGVGDSESPLEHKLRRAWEIISGEG